YGSPSARDATSARLGTRSSVALRRPSPPTLSYTFSAASLRAPRTIAAFAPVECGTESRLESSNGGWSPMKRSLALAGPVILFAFLASTTLRADDTFVHFESGPVRPLALSPVGSHLFAANIPDNRVEIFEIDRNGGLRSVG